MLNISCKKIGGIWFLSIGRIKITFTVQTYEAWGRKIDKECLRACVKELNT